MSFVSITRASLEILNQNLRAAGVSPGTMGPARGAAPTAADPSFGVSEDLLRVLPFVNVSDAAVARVYQVQVDGPLAEAEFTARAGGTPWTAGSAAAFGHELTATGSRMKKIELVVRIDRTMTPEMRDAQTLLARQSILRSLAEAVLGSNPATDDNRELAGLPYYLPANSPQDVRYDPGHKRRGGFAELIARVRPADDGLGTTADVVVTASQVVRGLVHELETLGVTPDFHYCPLTRRSQLHYFGVPLLEGRVPQPASADPRTEAWALKITGDSAVRLYHHGGDAFGISTTPVTTMATLDAANEAVGSTSGLSVHGTYGLLVPDPKSVARLRDIPLDPYA